MFSHPFIRSQGRTRLPVAALISLALAGIPHIAGADNRRDQAIFALEHALIGMGYELGPVDGLMDPQTHRALMAYQKQNELQDTSGSITGETLQALGIAAAESPAPGAGKGSMAKAQDPQLQIPRAGPNETIRIKPIETEALAADKQESTQRRWLFF